ncbi:glycosyltransferase family 4 protein, partial [Candidatus Woesearchaeota archaeon]|nr:glycosyltransferase family 4 protein [Candidatus Woesearchaeota archaeon]
LELIKGEFDIIHCPDSKIIDILYSKRNFFKKIPKFLYANGGAINPKRYPKFDFIQHHSLFSYSIAGKFKNKSFIVPYLVDTKRFSPSKNNKTEKDIKRKFKIPEHASLIISVGTICDNHKRMSHLIKEVSKVNNKNIHLLILGQESNESTKIKTLGKRLLRENVHFGSMKHSDLHKAYQASDLFVLSSLFEGFGIVYLEAMASGVPIIATNHENQKWIMKDSSILIDMKKNNLLSKTIAKIINDDKLLSNLSKKGLKRVQYFSRESIKNKYIKMYKKIFSVKFKRKKYTFKDKIINNIPFVKN